MAIYKAKADMSVGGELVKAGSPFQADADAMREAVARGMAEEVKETQPKPRGKRPARR